MPMMNLIRDQLIAHGMGINVANAWQQKINICLSKSATPALAWQILTQELAIYTLPFEMQNFLFGILFPTWNDFPQVAPAFIPVPSLIEQTNIYRSMQQLGFKTVKAFHAWTVWQHEAFWQYMIDRLAIQFSVPYTKVCDLEQGVEAVSWFKSGKLNIASSCFNAPADKNAIVYLDAKQQFQYLNYGQLNQLSNSIAHSLEQQGYRAGDVIGVVMPMHLYAVAIYLGIIKMGGIVVSIADSFSGKDILTRLSIAKAKVLLTQDKIKWADKKIELYNKLICAEDITLKLPLTIVVSYEQILQSPVLPLQKQQPMKRKIDVTWPQFFMDQPEYESKMCDPMTPCHILFSSGTTAAPKAIVWNHTTPIKAASDGYFHQDLSADDIAAWPTNLGWMMGPWLIFATLINQATLALYTEVPTQAAFGQFVQDAKVTMLGVVPTLVSTWRATQCMSQFDWRHIKLFSSTGECSNPEDMLYLMSLAHYKPIIEYCGGTEIGGAYVSSTIIEDNYPSLFSTPTMGSQFIILDENKNIATAGEVALIPPAIGLSTQLINADHHEIYYANMPTFNIKIDHEYNIHDMGDEQYHEQNIDRERSADSVTAKMDDINIEVDAKQYSIITRRHGDRICQLSNGYYEMLGRSDDAMNLGGIKISAAEIERVLIHVPGVLEVAAIGASISQQHGPMQLIIYAVLKDLMKGDIAQSTSDIKLNDAKQRTDEIKQSDVEQLTSDPVTDDPEKLRRIMQQCINQQLNPLFKIAQVIIVPALPKTPSNKIIRRALRGLIH